MVRAIATIVLCFIAGAFAGGVYWLQAAPLPARAKALHLGMTHDEAMAVMRRVDPGAFSGALCNGNEGVGASARYLGHMWQLMAHTTAETVTEVRLLRSSRDWARSWPRCRSMFEAMVMPDYRMKHPRVQWVTRSKDQQDGLSWISSAGRLSDGTQVLLEAMRPAGKLGLCTMSVLYSHENPAFVGAEAVVRMSGEPMAMTIQ